MQVGDNDKGLRKVKRLLDKSIRPLTRTILPIIILW